MVTADHGDAFFRHGRFGHNRHLYDDMVRIPLILRFPPAAGIAPRRLANPVETIDIAPTLLDYLGVAIPDVYEGDSLMPLIRGEDRTLAGPEVILATNRRDKQRMPRRSNATETNTTARYKGAQPKCLPDTTIRSSLTSSNPSPTSDTLTMPRSASSSRMRKFAKRSSILA